MSAMGNTHRRLVGTLALAGMALALSVASGSCSRQEKPKDAVPEPSAASAPQPFAVDQVPAPLPPLGRADIVHAAEAATDAAAQGAAYPLPTAALVGRTFSIRLPFGCQAQPPATADASVEINPKKGTMTLSVLPQIWTHAPWIESLVGRDGSIDAVEGFWIRRPWTTSDLCPPTPNQGYAGSRLSALSGAVAPPIDAVQPSAETLGLAHVYRSDDSRLMRHDRRPYQLTLKLAAERIPADHRFWLHLEGRLVALDDNKERGEGRPIRCAADAGNRRPICLVGVELDRVAFESQGSGEVLGEWPG
jgi:hypothetical protein